MYMAKQTVISYTGRLDLKDRKDSLLFMVTFIKGVAPRKFIGGCRYYISMVAGKPNSKTVKVTYTLLATPEVTKQDFMKNPIPTPPTPLIKCIFNDGKGIPCILGYLLFLLHDEIYGFHLGYFMQRKRTSDKSLHVSFREPRFYLTF